MSSGVPSVFTSKVGGGFPIRGTSRCLCVVVVGCLRGWPAPVRSPCLRSRPQVRYNKVGIIGADAHLESVLDQV